MTEPDGGLRDDLGRLFDAGFLNGVAAGTMRPGFEDRASFDAWRDAVMARQRETMVDVFLESLWRLSNEDIKP